MAVKPTKDILKECNQGKCEASKFYIGWQYLENIVLFILTVNRIAEVNAESNISLLLPYEFFQSNIMKIPV